MSAIFIARSTASRWQTTEAWSLQEVAENWELCTDTGGQRYLPVGDFLIHSDFVMFPLEREASPVFYLYERSQLAADTPEFFEKLIAGAFDFR